MADFNEEDYLDNLLKSIDSDASKQDEIKETPDELEERIIKEQVEEAVQKTNSDEAKEMVDYTDSTFDLDKLKQEYIKELEEDAIDTDDEIENIISPDIVRESANTDEVSTDKPLTDELSKEYQSILELENDNIKDIQDREPQHLTDEEIERLSSMELDDIISGVTGDNVSVQSLFEGNTDADTQNQEAEVKVAETGLEETIEEDFNEALETATVAGAAAAAMELIGDTTKKQNKKSKAKTKTKTKKKSLGTILKNIFFEIPEDNLTDENQNEDLKSEEILNDSTEDSLNQDMVNSSNEYSEADIDENQKVLQELYGDNIEGELLTEIEDEQLSKKGFFARLKEKFFKAREKHALEAKQEEEAEELEYQEKQKAKAEKKEAAKAKKAAKEEKPKKEKKEKKPKKEKKEKKPKQPPKPQDIMKIKPVSLLFLVLFVAGVVILIHILNSTFYYSRDIKNAKLYLQNGNYQKAYECIQGTTLRESDEALYEQITTVLYVEKQYVSYENYVKMHMGTEALDSLVKGILRYNTYYNKAKELGIAQYMDEVKVKIVEALQSTFKISEDKATSFGALLESDLTKYYQTIESYGGMVQ